MARLRIGGIAAADAPIFRLRLGGISATGTVGTTPRLRIGGIAATGTVAVALNDLEDQTVEPLDTVLLLAVPMIGSATPTSYTWRVVSGTATLSPVGDSCTFEAPGSEAGSTVVVGVKGTLASVDSPEQTASITIRPALIYAAGATTWEPSRFVNL